MTKNITVKRCRRGKTVTIPPADTTGLISPRECQALLKINSYMTLHVYMKTLGFSGQKFISWEQFNEILQLQSFLRLKAGYNSKQMFLALRSTTALGAIFEEYDVNIQQRFEKLKNEYNQKRQTQSQQGI